MLNSSENNLKSGIFINLTLNHVKSANVSEISEVMKQMGITPYIYVRQSLRYVVDGNFKESFKVIEYAGEFAGIYYPEGSIQNNDFKQTINLLRYLVLHLADEFGILGPFTECKDG